MEVWYPCHIKKMINITALYTAFIQQYGYDFNFVGETHNFWEISFVLDGTVCVASDSNIFSVNAGHAIIHRPMTFHRLWAGEGAPPKLATISFDAEIDAEITDCVYELDGETAKQMCDIIEHIQDEFENNGIAIKRQKSPTAQITINRLENLVMSLFPNRSPSETIRSSAAGVRKYTEIVRCLTDNINTNLTVDDIARICNMSPSSVKQTFRQFTGMGVVQFYRRMKMDSAISMLRKGLSVKEISQRLGYTDSNYFSTVFKRVIGVSPTSYLTKMQGKDNLTLR
ncbi:MAG: AraC family transcriptional regulator [Clostridia bacterium]|nr:AraC family transcriptional regulator [Clostridia bacterium]